MLDRHSVQSLCHTLFRVPGIHSGQDRKRLFLTGSLSGGRKEKNNIKEVMSGRGKWSYADRLEHDSVERGPG